ncbi:hypothetical protein KOR34_37630 [Posidoniimonas corsicana]|uniref:MoxR-vWA-beta-propeller ternary system domain-containing protein n=1 Tax=Posidoniimonas corsicana TaxID=1938618 RepID=A0A5C5V7W7_9BACT|nr:hypothetical protein [Posidoniimonas corsicana]TWT33927.1 hypothetical protein KOR34_37630 [Posidoniimonas corsicana]
MPASPLSTFVSALLDGDPLRVDQPAPLSDSDIDEAARVVVQFEQGYRLETPGNAPRIDEPAVRWSAAAFYLACSLALHRDFTADALEGELPSEPDRSEPSHHYSVDLVFRFLPALVKLANSAASDDPLVGQLMRWAREWPLSSVGVPGVGEVDSRVVLGCPALASVYVDRVLATADVDRLREDPVRDAVAAALGDHLELCPKVASNLSPTREPEEAQTSE